MIRAVVTVPSHMTIQAAVEEFFVAYGYGGFPVSDEGQVVGIIGVEDVQAIPQALWAWKLVRDDSQNKIR